jgi:asparagine synthase (glutamine-hydrolysing)
MADRYPNIVPHWIRVPAGSFFLDDAARFFEAAEAPFRNAQNRPWWEAILRESANQGVRVLLSGGAGNLTISWNGAFLLPQLIRQMKWRRAFREVRGLAGILTLADAAVNPLLPDLLWLSLQRLRRGNDPVLSAHQPWRAYSPIHPEFARRHRVEERARETGHSFHWRPKRDAISQRRYGLRGAELGTDINRGHEELFGVQVRDPTRDQRLLEFCFALPEDQYSRAGRARWLIRRAMADRLPPEILANRRRGLQAADSFERLLRARTRLDEELALLGRNELARTALDLGRLRSFAESIGGALPGADRTHREYRTIFMFGLMMGRFLIWSDPSDH